MVHGIDSDLVQNRLRRGEIVELEGVKFKYIGEWRDLRPGDFYAAERNQGPRLLTVANVKEFLGAENEYAGAVYPRENDAYCYDLYECVKIEEVED